MKWCSQISLSILFRMLIFRLARFRKFANKLKER